jgi:putative transposase
LVKDHKVSADARAWEESAGAKEVRALQWATSLERALQAAGRTLAEAKTTQKSARWKLAIAAWMKEHTQASNTNSR